MHVRHFFSLFLRSIDRSIAQNENENAAETIKNDADTLEKIINEVAATRITERGGRMDDKRSESAMEDRKKEGYF